MQQYDVITFDCYGTLIDWEEGITRAFLQAGKSRAVDINGERILSVYHQIEPMVEAESFRSYRSVLQETARRVARTFAWELGDGELNFLPDSLPQWRPFEETNRALERLQRSGYSLAILSNVDDDLILKTKAQFTVPFEFVITAQQVRSYKPELGHFVTAREKIGDRRWLHAAQSYFHDIVPARALGIPCAWINRKGSPVEGDERPDFEFRNLSEFAEAMTV